MFDKRWTKKGSRQWIESLSKDSFWLYVEVDKLDDRFNNEVISEETSRYIAVNTKSSIRNKATTHYWYPQLGELFVLH